MGLVSNGVVVNVLASSLPSAYTKNPVTTFTDYEYEGTRTTTVVKSSVENATDTTTIANIVADIKSQIDTEITADYDTTLNTITVYYVWKSYTTNFDLDNVLFTNGAINYLCTVDVFIKTS